MPLRTSHAAAKPKAIAAEATLFKIRQLPRPDTQRVACCAGAAKCERQYYQIQLIQMRNVKNTCSAVKLNRQTIN